MVDSLEEFKDGVKKATKSTMFKILAEMHRELIDEPNESAIRYFWKVFRLSGFRKIKRAVDLYLKQNGHREIGPERFCRNRSADGIKSMVDIGLFLINEAYSV